MPMIDLGIPEVRPLPGIAARPQQWQELVARMHRRIFLRSEGTSVEVGAPQVVSGELLARSKALVARMNRFYAGAAASYYTRPELRDEFLVNPMIDPLLELDADQPVATPLSRFDVVLSRDGGLRVIEINSVGVCLFHMRSLLYLVRELARGGFEPEARELDRLVRDTVVAGFLRFVESRVTVARRPVVGALTPSGFFRAGQLLYRAAFERHGCDYVYGGPEHLEVTADAITIRGKRIDVLWADFFFYLAYQEARYRETKWPTKLPDFGQTPRQAAELIANPHFLAHLRARRVVLISPARAYLALPKSLLSWVHRRDRPVDETDRAHLAEHVARTYSARDRLDGLIAREALERDRGDYVIKPCQYGGSHGVLLGRSCEAGAWRQRLGEVWDDPSWVVQQYHHPVDTSAGDALSIGLPSFDGVLGGVYVRTSKSAIISARDAGFIAATMAE